MLSKKNAIHADAFESFEPILDILPEEVISLLKELRRLTKNFFIIIDWWGSNRHGLNVTISVCGYSTSRSAATIFVSEGQLVSIKQEIGDIYFDSPLNKISDTRVGFLYSALVSTWEVEKKELKRTLSRIEKVME